MNIACSDDVQKIGDFNEFGENCRVGPNVESIGSGCSIGMEYSIISKFQAHKFRSRNLFLITHPCSM